MARQIIEKYELRRRKALRRQRARALVFDGGGGHYGSSDRVPYVWVTRQGPLWRFPQDGDGPLLEPGPHTYKTPVRDLGFFNRLTAEEFWAVQAEVDEERRRYYERRVYRSQQTAKHNGKRSFKRRYHRLRRLQSRLLCHYALREDEERFESIPNCDYFRGAIKWDIY